MEQDEAETPAPSSSAAAAAEGARVRSAGAQPEVVDLGVVTFFMLHA